LNGIDAVTATASHEMLEAVTDPHPITSPAYSGVNDVGLAFSLYLGGAELADMCDGDTAPFVTPRDLPFVVQRGWSNRAAASGHDPCVPAIQDPYFNAVPRATDHVEVFGSSPALGIKVPFGTSRTVDVDLFSDGPTDGEFQVIAQDYGSLLGGTEGVRVSLDKSTGKNGDTLRLTITPVAANPRGVEPILFQSTLGGRTTRWITIVGQ
jgi:hypothetical protein